MLATLNLQLSSVELLDDQALSPVSLAPGETGESGSGFADLLRLRVDASQIAHDTSGELLPEGGSELPIITELAPTEPSADLLATLDIDAGSVKLAPAPLEIPVEQESSSLTDEAVDLILESPVFYPPATAIGADPESLTLTPIATGALLQTTPSPQPAKAVADVNGKIGAASERPINLNTGPSTLAPATVIDGLEGRAKNPAADAAVSVTAGLSLRDRRQQGEPAGRPATITLPNTAPDADDRASLTEFAKRFDLAAAQRTEPLADGLQSRFNVAQAAQNLQTPANLTPQPAHSALSLSSGAAAAADLSYAATVQQSTDLIGTSVRDRAWGEQLGDRVVMMAANQLKQAEIRLTPAELGPLRVQVSVDDGNAHVTFHAQHAVTRDALEQALPRLREMLAENGLSLGQADVSDRGVADDGRDQAAGGEDALSPVGDDATELDLDLGVESLRRATTSNSLLDTFV